MKKRTRGRELALQFLYQVDLRGGEHLDAAEDFIRGEETDGEARSFALRLVQGTWGDREAIDRVIQEVAQNWDIARMAVVDRNVLRVATYELISCHDIPPKVAINEAIELGKRFSTQNSGAFINGILDKIKSRHTDPDRNAPRRGRGRGSKGKKASCTGEAKGASAPVTPIQRDPIQADPSPATDASSGSPPPSAPAPSTAPTPLGPETGN